jgi:peroxiredoxin
MAGMHARAATDAPLSEAEFRKAMGLSATQAVAYQAMDGSALTFHEFGRRVEAGNAFDLDKAATGTVVLRLKKSSAAGASPALPASLPDFSFKTVDGQTVRRADVADRPLLISFFFSTCVPCIQEVGILNAFARKHPEYHYLAVTFDPSGEAARFIQRYDLKWPVVPDAQAFVSAMGVVSYPTYLFASPGGTLLARSSGLDERALADPQTGVKVLEDWIAAAR